MSTTSDNLALQEEAGEMTLLEQVMQETRMSPGDDGFDTARMGVEAFIADLVSEGREAEKN